MQELLNTCLGDTSSSEPNPCIPKNSVLSLQHGLQGLLSCQTPLRTWLLEGICSRNSCTSQLRRLGVFEPACLGAQWQWPAGSCHVMRSISQQINDNITSFMASPQNKLDVYYTRSNRTSHQNHLDQGLIKVPLETTKYYPWLWKRCIK